MAFSIEKSLANHAVFFEQFGQLLEGAGAAVSDVVVAVVAKGDGVLRHILGSVDAVAQNAVRFACLVGSLPDVSAVVVLELPNLSHSLVVHNERSVLR